MLSHSLHRGNDRLFGKNKSITKISSLNTSIKCTNELQKMSQSSDKMAYENSAAKRSLISSYPVCHFTKYFKKQLHKKKKLWLKIWNKQIQRIFMSPTFQKSTKNDQGPAVQSIISSTSSLMVKTLTVLVSTISNSQVFLLKKM